MGFSNFRWVDLTVYSGRGSQHCYEIKYGNPRVRTQHFGKGGTAYRGATVAITSEVVPKAS